MKDHRRPPGLLMSPLWPLWFPRTAREIVALLTEDIAEGHLTAEEGADLIHRVWARTHPEGETD